MGDFLQEREDKVFTNADQVALTMKVQGDTNNRFQQRPDGTLEFGSGSATPDVVAERTAAGEFDFTTGKLLVGGRAVMSEMVTLSDSTTITAALHANRTLLLTGTGAAKTQTMPAATGTGNRYLFIVGAVNTSNHVITGLAGDKLYGNIVTNSTGDTPDLAQPWPADQSDDILITLNGTTTGGQAIGDWVELIDIATDKWFVRGVTTSSGAEATPFS